MKRPGNLLWRLLLSGCLLALPAEKTAAQNSTALTDTLLQRIAALQAKEDGFYFAGVFPTERRYALTGRTVADNNIFFTGLTVFTLRTVKLLLSPGQQALCDTIIRRATNAYSHFRNRDGRPTYSFWTPDPPLVFPHSPFLNLFNELDALPDDLDDTVILLLGLHPADSVAREVKRLMGRHANTVERHIRNTRRKYRGLPAYSTWFGERWPVDFDFSVQCNALYFVYAYGLPLNRYDSATIHLLSAMIRERDYLRRPAFISPHYGRTSLVLYHIARLLGRFSIPALDQWKPQLLQDAENAYGEAGDWLDKVILSTAILRLGGNAPAVPFPDSADLVRPGLSFFYSQLCQHAAQSPERNAAEESPDPVLFLLRSLSLCALP